MNTLDLTPVRLLAEFNISQRQALIPHGKLIVAAAGQKIVEQGAKSSSLYFVLDGKLGIYLGDKHGGELHLRTVETGGHFGEISLFGVSDRTANVRAIVDSTLFELDSNAFAQILAVPDLAIPLLRALARSLAVRLADTTELVTAFWSQVFSNQ